MQCILIIFTSSPNSFLIHLPFSTHAPLCCLFCFHTLSLFFFFCCPYIVGCVVFHWSMVDLSCSILLEKETESPTYSRELLILLMLGLELCAQLSFWLWDFIWFRIVHILLMVLQMSTYVSALLCPEETVPLNHPLTLALKFFPPPLPQCSLNPWGSGTM